MLMDVHLPLSIDVDSRDECGAHLPAKFDPARLCFHGPERNISEMDPSSLPSGHGWSLYCVATRRTRRLRRAEAATAPSHRYGTSSARLAPLVAVFCSAGRSIAESYIELKILCLGSMWID